MKVIFILGCGLGIVISFAFMAILKRVLTKPIVEKIAKLFKWHTLYYRVNSNAIILSRIIQCRDYLMCFFGEKKPGQIWLYRNDLYAFWNKEAFDSLYVEVVNKNKNISKVLILVEESDFSRITKKQWEKIHRHLDDEPRLQSLIQMRQFVIKKSLDYQSEFHRYLSDEAFIFYTRREDLFADDAICIHRRFDRETPNPSDLRITLVAGNSSSKHEYPLECFMSERVAKGFQNLFRGLDHQWKNLYDIASEEIKK